MAILWCGVVSLKAFGAQASSQAAGVPFDLQGFIDKEIAAGNQRIVVPPGRYRVSPKDRQHLVLRGLKDIEICAAGVEMICTETTRALTISRCTNLTLSGLVIDYDPLPFTQGRITGLSADKKVHEVELFPGYPGAESARNFKYEIFRSDTRTLRCEDHYPQKVEVVDAAHLRITNAHGSPQDPEQVGDIIAIGAEYAPHGSIPHAIECSDNVKVWLENIELYASNCFGFVETDCDGTTYYRCRIDRREPQSDPVHRADPRIRSLDADAFHSKHAVKGPAYLECRARFMGDDAINICGDYHMVMAAQGRELRVLAKHDMNIRPGDPVELVAYAGQRLPDAVAVSIQPAGGIRDEERAFLAQQRMNESLRTASGGSLNKAYTIVLDREREMTRGGVICSANRIGNGFAVQDCTFGYNRSRGILIKASRGEVSGNHLEGCWMSAILVSPEYWWLEAGSSSDLAITGNTIAACRGKSIRIEAAGGNGKVAPAGAHQNITVSGNTITGCSLPGIYVTSTDGLRLENNTFLAPTADRMSEPAPGGLEPVETVNCTGITRKDGQLDLKQLRNPVWRSEDNLRDPSVLKTPDGYRLFYSRLSGSSWGSADNWAIACVSTRDFVHFENDHDVSPKGFASPGDVVSWHGRYVLPYQSYPTAPNRLCFSESADLRSWSAPQYFLDEGRQLSWNQAHRLIDPTFVVDGDTLHCFFVGSGFRKDAGGQTTRGNLIGHAVTQDPKLEHWEVLSVDAPVIGFSARAPDGVENTMVIRTGDHWSMIYSEGLANQHLALATSTDLRQWNLQGPIALPRQQWMARKYGAPFVWRDGTRWMMILMGENSAGRTTFGLLSSPDGRSWTLLPE